MDKIYAENKVTTYPHSNKDIINTKDEDNDYRFICQKCGSHNVKLRPFYGSVSVCKDCKDMWKNKEIGIWISGRYSDLRNYGQDWFIGERRIRPTHWAVLSLDD